MSPVLELVANVKVPEFDVACAGSPNCGAACFSGEVEGAPNLKANENAGFASFGVSLCTTTGGLAGSLVDEVGVDCSGVVGLGLSVELMAPNPAKGVPDELPNENIDDVDPFCSKLVTAGSGSVVEAVDGADVVETFVDSTGLRGKSPNKLDDGWLPGRRPGVNDPFSESPLNGVGVGAGVGSTFSRGVGKTDVAGEGVVEASVTGGMRGGNIDWGVSSEPDCVTRPFVPAERGV